MSPTAQPRRKRRASQGCEKRHGYMRPAFSAAGAAAAALTLLTLTACASTRAVDTRLPAAYEAPSGQAGAVELDQWWTAFGDAQLTGLIEQALAASPDARTAAARLREARVTRAGAFNVFLPQGNLVGSSTRTESEVVEGTEVNIPGFSSAGESQRDAIDFDVSWEIDLFGRIFAARRAANAEMAAARLDYEATRASLAANVADSYFAARGLSIQLADAQETVRIQSELLRITTIRAQRGIGPTTDADRVAGDLAQAQSQAAGLQAQLQAAQRSLLILVGRGIEPTASLPVEPVVGAVPAVPASIPGELLARRPDVRQADALLRSALGREDYARLAFFPTVRLAPGIGLTRVEQPGYSATTQAWSIGANVTVPILDVPQLLTNLRVQNARTEQAAIAYERAVQTAFGEAENGLVQLAADRRRIELLRDGEMRSRRAFEASRLGFQNGLTDIQTLLSVEQSWRVIRAQYASAQVQGLRRAVTTYKALGGGWPAQDVPTNREAR